MSAVILAWISAYLAFNMSVMACDLRSRRVPNALLVTAFCMQSAWLGAQALSWVGAPPGGAPNVVDAVLAFVAALALFFPLWRLRVMGAGDVKFLAVLGYASGLGNLLPALWVGSVLAGLHAVALALVTRYPAAVFRSHVRAWRRIPYAAYLAVGALAGLAWTLARQS